MKNLKIIKLTSVALLFIVLVSCVTPGETINRLNGNESRLPDELKGLKVYWVSTGAGIGVNVAILNGQINSTTYTSGKTQQSTIIINKQSGRVIQIGQILLENDSLIVCKKN